MCLIWEGGEGQKEKKFRQCILHLGRLSAGEPQDDISQLCTGKPEDNIAGQFKYR